MAETVGTQVQTEVILSSSEVDKYLHKDVQKEAALAAMAANYDHQRFKQLDTYDGEFAKYFKAIKDEKRKAKFTKETLETAKALQPAIDYYVKVLPNELLGLPFFCDKNESAHSAHFGSLPSVEESDFRRGLYRLQAICEVTRQSYDRGRGNIMSQYHHDRDKMSPYSSMELSQANLLYEMLFYRMFQICDKLFDSMEEKECRPNPVARKSREKKIVHGIVCQGLQFMYEFETQTTDGVREELVQKISKGHWVRPRFWRDHIQRKESVIIDSGILHVLVETVPVKNVMSSM
ncbi:unnamed protein product [Clonostachys byssicola]|uniref:Uncharacterized protein n=1 Tax=Clonostachys byssicola TaxID=160290 RepID=A0A9N9U987_9HYPO|nr:unnamed protein product [Clonostachys byssicola]